MSWIDYGSDYAFANDVGHGDVWESDGTYYWSATKDAGEYVLDLRTAKDAGVSATLGEAKAAVERHLA